MKKTPKISRHDLRHPHTGKYIPRPENHLRNLLQAAQAKQAMSQAAGPAASLGGGQGLIPLLLAMRGQNGGIPGQ